MKTTGKSVSCSGSTNDGCNDMTESWQAVAEDLQSRVAFQEDAIQDLSMELLRQSGELERLRILCKDVLQKNLELREQIETLERPPLDERPPHY